MTHITKARVIGNHADMGRPVPAIDPFPAPAIDGIPLTVKDILRAGARCRLGRREMVVAESTWDAEGGAIGVESQHSR